MEGIVSPHYQPIVEITTGRVSHFEALARTPVGTPGHVRLIETGEIYGFVHLIDMAVLEHAFRQLREYPAVSIAVNISVVTIERSCAQILSLIFANMDVVRRMVIEITETVEIKDLAMICRFVSAIRLLDGRIAIDDFDTGHFTVPLVEKIRPDFLKLSYLLVSELATKGDVICQLRDLIRWHRGEIIAEQVDSREKLDALRKLNVKYAQGYYIARPESRLVHPDSAIFKKQEREERVC